MRSKLRSLLQSFDWELSLWVIDISNRGFSALHWSILSRGAWERVCEVSSHLLVNVFTHTTHLSNIKTNNFNCFVDSEQSKSLHWVEESWASDANPSDYTYYSKDLVSKESALAWIIIEQSLLSWEKSSCNSSPYSSKEMDWSGFNWVINMKHIKDLAACNIPQSANASNNKGSPRLNLVAAASDWNQSNQSSITKCATVVSVHKVVGSQKSGLNKYCNNTTCRSWDDSVHNNLGWAICSWYEKIVSAASIEE